MSEPTDAIRGVVAVKVGLIEDVDSMFEDESKAIGMYRDLAHNLYNVGLKDESSRVHSIIEDEIRHRTQLDAIRDELYRRLPESTKKRFRHVSEVLGL